MKYFFLLGVILALFPAGTPCEADCNLTLVPNKSFHEDGDILSLDVMITNSETPLDVNFYLCLEILGVFYFYPSFSTIELDHIPMSLPAGYEKRESIIPAVELPGNLPALNCTIYAAAFHPGTWNLASNVAMDYIRMKSSWDDLPVPAYDNTFYFMPGVHGLSCSDPQTRYDDVAGDIFDHFDSNGIYARLGVTILDALFDGETESDAAEAAEKAETAGLVIGYHTGVTCHHTFGEMDALRQSDRRFNQWESDGSIYNTSEHDLTTMTVSRYAEPLVAMRRQKAMAYGRGFKAALDQYPDTVVCANGPIEVELRRAFNDQPHYADYSPFMVMEFRDWITHRGKYDDSDGEFAGEGFPMELIGDYDFSRDPSPAVPFDRAMSFNQVFGTAFTTWDLLYWDPVRFPDTLPMTADPMPQPGQSGHTSGGFDPPRDLNGTLHGGNALFQSLWDGWRSGLHHDYRVGFGFRQAAVQQYVSDNSRWLLAGGVPLSRNFTHQIPVDFIGNWVRERGSASPFWTAINPHSNAGYTAYFDTAIQEDLFLVTRMLSPRWGLFEYHPDPFMTNNLAYYTQALEALYIHRCQILVPIELYEDADGNYKLIGSVFEAAVNQFFQASWPGTAHRRFDQPYFNMEWIDYVPPQVTGITYQAGTLTWNDYIWSAKPDLDWVDWGEFAHFSVHQGNTADFSPDNLNRVTTTRSTSLAGMPSGFYKVLAVSGSGVTSRP